MRTESPILHCRLSAIDESMGCNGQRHISAVRLRDKPDSQPDNARTRSDDAKLALETSSFNASFFRQDMRWDTGALGRDGHMLRGFFQVHLL